MQHAALSPVTLLMVTVAVLRQCGVCAAACACLNLRSSHMHHSLLGVPACQDDAHPIPAPWLAQCNPCCVADIKKLSGKLPSYLTSTYLWGQLQARCSHTSAAAVPWPTQKA